MNHSEQRAATHLADEFQSDQHLTEDQFADLVAGLSTEAMDLHVRRCEACRSEVLRVQEAVSLFADAGREWSTLQPAAIASAEAARAIRRRSMWLNLRPVAGFAAAAALVFGVTISTRPAPSAPAHIALNSLPMQIAPVTASPDAPPTAARETKSAERTEAPGLATIDTPATALPEAVASSPVSVASMPVQEAEVSAQEVAKDNALMAAIDAEMTTPYTMADVSRPFHGQ